MSNSKVKASKVKVYAPPEGTSGLDGQFHVYVFDAVVTFEDTGERKPSPAPFREVLRRLGAQPQASLMIGDWAERDVVGARSLGMKTVFARYGDTFDTKESGADFDIDDVFELVAIVDELNGAGGAVSARSAPDHPVREDA